MNGRLFRGISQALLFLGAVSTTQGAVTSIASSPLVTSAASAVLPNLTFVLDDSGSMDWNYLPDWASGAATVLAKNSRYNGVAYDPAVTYRPPVRYNVDGTLDTTTYPSQTGTSAATGADIGVAMPNWKVVKNDAYGVQTVNTSDLTNSAFYFTFLPGEYCTDEHRNNCAVLAAPNATYPVTAYLRWCDSVAQTNNDATPAVGVVPRGCQAVWTSGSFNTARYPGLFTGTPATSDITVALGTGVTTSVSGITVDGKQIMSAATATSAAVATVASRIVSAINACTSHIPGVIVTGACEVGGYSAVRTGAANEIVRISAPPSLTTSVHAFTPVVTKVAGGTLTFATVAFAGYGLAANQVNVPGRNVRTSIVATRDSYPFPGTASKAPSRTDCAGATCTYVEEMTNYANWFTYYQTRMQMMKTSASLAFQQVGPTYRVGYFSINNNTGTDFLNVSDFNMTQKRAWYAKLFAAKPDNSTPLLPALTNSGRMYAGKLNGAAFNGDTVIDPMQYSCQQNFTILSTDGYWNSGSGRQLDGVTLIGQQDGAEIRPFVDQSTVSVTTVTPWSQKDQQTTVTNVAVTTPYTRTTTTLGAACGAAVPPVACVQDNAQNSSGNVRTWCMTTSTAGVNSQFDPCLGPLGAGGASPFYACRGINNPATLPANGAPTACKTDGAGDTFCVFPNNITAGTTACSGPVRPGNNVYVCKLTAPGTTVSVQTQTANRTATGTTTSVDDVTSTWTMTSVDGAAPTKSAVTTTSANVTPPTFVATVPSDDSGVPAAGAYVNSGAPVVTCQAAPPASGSTAGAAGAPVSSVTGPPSVTTTPLVAAMAGPQTQTFTGAGGTPNTLADVSEYYYKTDLRTPALNNCTGAVVPPAVSGSDVCSNDVPATGEDANSSQHMTTFTLGLGASGYMLFSPGYATATSTSDDFFAIKNGATANGSSICSWQANGTTCNWPVPVSNTQTTIDDLWHTAVNGRGTYFSATNPATLSAGLNSALSGVSARSGSAAAATTSNPNVTSGDNFVFSSTFSTMSWDGELVRQQIDLTTGVVSSAIDWAAQAKLDLRVPYTGRTIYTFDSGAANKLKAFSYAGLTNAEKAYFNKPSIDGLSQFCAAGATCLDAITQSAAAGANLVNFLRGERSNEGIATDTSKYYRARKHVLGDIVTAEAVYVKKSLFKYTDRGYLTTPDGTSYTPFVTANKTRRGMVYAASNDGMLHAFYAASAPCTTLPVPSASPPVAAVPADCDPDITVGAAVSGGDEAWAYIPALVMPNLYKLADKNYASLHSYSVDGTPVVADICTSNCNATPKVVESGEAATFAISSATWAAGEATITTAQPHGYVVGTVVVISDVAASGYNGTFTVTAVPTPTSFKFALVVNPGASPDPVWKTILVAGLNAGGRGYYALDITDPLAPKALWEYTDTNMGYTYGNPEVAKLKDGTWVVMVTSGYNNLSPGDGVGRLYVLNANTGALIRTISTGVGSSAGALSTASWSGGTATITTSAAHGLAVGNSVSVTGFANSGYNGTFTVSAVPSATKFQYALPVDPFVTLSGRVNPRAVTAASWSAGPPAKVTLDFAAAHGLNVGDSITVSGFDNANTGYNGTFTVSDVPVLVAPNIPGSRLKYVLASDPGGWAATGSEAVSRTASIATPWAAGEATVTTATAHGLAVGNTVTVAGFSPSGYNGTVAVTAVPTVTTFKYALASDPAASGAVAGGTPSNLGRIRAWADNATNDNTALRVYGGDMQGNVWRFDVNGDVGAAGYDAQLLVTLYADLAGTKTQPITSRPELGEITVGVTQIPVVYVGTGRYLGTPDLADVTQQTMYAIKDHLDSTTLGNPRLAATGFVQQVQTTTLCPTGTPTTICRAGESVRTTTNNAVNFLTNNGWYVDFPDAGERDDTDSVLQLGTLVFNTNVPSVSVCTAGGTSYTWFLDYKTGGAVSSSTTGVTARRLGSALATRPTVVRLPNNTVVALSRLSDSTTTTSNVAIGTGAGVARRVSWRELITE